MCDYMVGSFWANDLRVEPPNTKHKDPVSQLAYQKASGGGEGGYG